MIWLLLALGCWQDPPPPSADPLTAEVHALSRDIRRAFERCDREVVSRLDVATASKVAPEVSLSEVEASCLAAGDRYAALAADHLGRSRDLDWLLGQLARLGDDSEYVLRELRSGPSPGLVLAIKHIHEAVAKGEEVADKVLANERVWPSERELPQLDAAAWDREWRNSFRADQTDFGKLPGIYERYAYIQGTQKALVRRRMLAHFGHTAEAHLADHRRLLAHAPDPVATDAASAYLEALDGFVGAYLTAMERYVAGEVTNQALRDELAARLEHTYATWRRAWEVETERLAAP